MGCNASKEQDLPLVARCRQRRELIRAASNYRYALAAAHVSYFRSLKDVGDALRKFVDEDLITASISSSVSSPSLILPPTSKKKKHNNAEKLQLNDSEDGDESHLYLSDSSSSDDVKEDGDSNNFKQQQQQYNHHELDSDDQTHQHHTHHAREHRGKKDFSSHYPRGGFNGYNQSFGDGFANDPYVYPYTFSYPPHQFGGSYMDQWSQPGVRPPLQPWYFTSNSNVYYMNKAAPEMKTVIREPPPEPTYGYSNSYWNSPASNGGNYGYFPWGSTAKMKNNDVLTVSPRKETPPPPSPKGSGWEYLDAFNLFDNEYAGYYMTGTFRSGSNNDSPDSSELRKREGIPDLEEDTENEVPKEFLQGNRMKTEARKHRIASSTSSRAVPSRKSRDPILEPSGKSEASSRSVPFGKSEVSSRSVPLGKSEDKSRSVSSRKPDGSSSRSVAAWGSEKSSMPSRKSEQITKPSMPSTQPYVQESLKSSMSTPNEKGTSSWANLSPSNSISLTDGQSSSDTIVSKGVDEGSVQKAVDTSNQDADSSKLSNVTILSPNGTRDLQEVVAEIRDDFEFASSYGKEVANLLEVGKLPHHPGPLKVILSGVSCYSACSLSAQDPSSAQSVKVASRSMKSAKSYFEDVGKDANANACKLSSTLDKLYAWENKLYKEVKDEERLRVMYEKQCKRLKMLDEGGAESSKVDAAQASISKLLTKLEVSVKAIDAISGRIHKLRDEELQPQVAALIHGLIRMWKAMLKCHRKQFQSIMDSKMRKLKANTGIKTDSSSRARATSNLERELRLWCERFIDWISFQKSYIESLNGWLLQCVLYEPEETPDGPVPYSPGQLGAPPIFVICNDWHQATESISEARVTNAMNTLVTSLRQLGEKQDEEGRQRLKAEYLSKDFEKHLRAHHKVMSDKTGLPLVPSIKGTSPFDDQKGNLDLMRRRLAEERIKHKDAKKLVHNAASSSLQGGLVPIFKTLENFTSDTLKLHEHVRLKHPRP